ncbi:Maf family protein [[Clostridium] polysaccharolyticum]|uniref:dTTP/UTP pyrophosphatase n=1 Tax=[Clostridium] polysaccharolyticum TaxID=29364 RepID=A0A1H9YWF1_9FIRM|nr:Maf family protein [[Clostridium] polysaccharolyticum]SES73521.1 septum formation protein [[Clostridium] polysaccharolyticum]
MYQVILASGSPRRREILEQCGISFRTEKSNAEEIITQTKPCEVVKELSLVKALEVADRVKEGDYIVLGADTIVANGDMILGKPKSEKEAEEMIAAIQGHEHSVYTGVTAVIKKNGAQKQITFYEETKVFIAAMTEEEIADYVASGESMDKAGAYAIQGLFASYVKGIEGDYYNVVGLPVCALMEHLKENGVNLKKDCRR